MLAADVVQLIFQRGQFDANATYMVSQALIFLSFAIIPYVFRDSVTRIFYSFNDSKTPFLVAFSSIVLKFILNYCFIDKLGIAAITLSTSLVTLFNAILLGAILLKKIDLGYKLYFKNLIKMFIAGLISFGLVYIVYNAWQIQDMTWFALAIKTASIIILCMITYLIVAVLFKIEYVGELIDRAKNYIKQKFVR